MTDEKIGVGVGYGKVILFGEHFVVHGYDAIVASLPSIKTVVEVKEGPWNMDDKVTEAFKRILSTLSIEGKTFSVVVKQTVPIGQNLGSSAALNVAFARAVNDLLKLGKSDDEINKAAWEGEVVFHGTPSGIDNSAATYGKPLVFKRLGPGKFDIKPFSVGKSLHLLIVSTGQNLKSTKETVDYVRERKEQYPAMTEHVFEAYGFLFNEAIKAIEKGELPYIGYLMDVDHGLLSCFNLSTDKTELARLLLQGAGALGSKITGGGAGGNLVALFDSEEKAKAAAELLQAHGFKSFYSVLS